MLDPLPLVVSKYKKRSDVMAFMETIEQDVATPTTQRLADEFPNLR